MLTIQKVTKINWEEAISIQVFDNQKNLVPSVTESLAIAYIKPWDEILDPFIVYINNKIVGFYYVSYTPNSTNNYWLGGLIIDKKYQNKGLGSTVLHHAILHTVHQHPSCKIILISVHPKNIKARHLYTKYGFMEMGEFNKYGEQLMCLKIE